ncbi:Exo-1,4-beta-D-glucosaminidase [Purpureocillium takamizusanense]|uniref:Exo-1,4-beta-D-glucosaminidase n=1 Tax=Purpureocillium takamizusanense TaxID=2060973 RepID=A0A9Q8Q8P3_9HYPO|nr:Exo-1,4-beta-D-glucosaminidase [Purpureocillium takamizusanense]UNI15623.1 Exo-1,4-beta-D-glucosaminidase [Purpureocillium takamizusanense]
MFRAVTTLALLGGGVLLPTTSATDDASSSSSSSSTSAKPLTSKPGQTAPIPNWHFQSSASVDNNLTALSGPGVDTSAWHFVDAPSCTLMGCLLKSGTYRDDELWFSDALSRVNASAFNVPWIYRGEFSLPKARPGQQQQQQHFLLETHGITSKADLYLNGHEVANASFQSGAYGGHSYDVTRLVREANVLAVRAYNTSYDYDFGVSFEDWNPPAPDHGTGIWRDIDVRQTGPVALKPLAVTVDIGLPVEKHDAEVTVHATARNLEDRPVKLSARCTISDPKGKEVADEDEQRIITLAPFETRTVQFTKTVKKPQIWWPKQWGAQPLYSANVVLSVDDAAALSDAAQTSFGIRTVTSEVNRHNDTGFAVNGYPFQVLGGGYGADMFLRWDAARFTAIAKYVLDMGLNTIRLEGKMEQPELYDIADRMGLFVMPGWECCTKWEAWIYNTEDFSDPPLWDDGDYATAQANMVHEAAALQTHPSVLAYLVGSDYWPDDRATKLYVDALRAAHWQTPIISSAAKRGFPQLLGPSGMKMDGPYDWIPPNYWYDVDPSEARLGAAFGFGSELGPGVGTPELGSLKKFLNETDMDDLWKSPGKGLYHMSTSASKFHTRTIYNAGLFHRYGAPTSLDDYLMKAQLTDYEATRAQHEAYSAHWTSERPATGSIYWMLNNGWPSLHWNQFDYYLHPGGSYFGTKTGSRVEHVAYDYVHKQVWLINHSLGQRGRRSVEIELIDLQGRVLSSKTVSAETAVNGAKTIAAVDKVVDGIKDVGFLRLRLMTHDGKTTLSRNVYWLGKQVDALDWGNSTWYSTPVSDYVDYTALSGMKKADVAVKVGHEQQQQRAVVLENRSGVPAFFVSLNLVDAQGEDVTPVGWSDNYVTLWPHETLSLTVDDWEGRGAAVRVKGVNVDAAEVKLR